MYGALATLANAEDYWRSLRPTSLRLTSGRQTCDEERQVNCVHCQGKMKRSTAPFHVDRNGYHLLVDTVPAWVCGQCGEAYFDEREVDAIQQAIRSLDDHTRMLVIPA